MKRYFVTFIVSVTLMCLILMGCGGSGSDYSVVNIKEKVGPSQTVTVNASQSVNLVLSGTTVSVEANTFEDGVSLTLLEKDTSSISSDYYKASSKTFKLRAVLESETEGDTIIKEVEKPILISIQKDIQDASEYYLGIKTSDSEDFSYSYIAPDNTKGNPTVVSSLRASTVNDYKTKSEFYILTNKVDAEFTLCAHFAEEGEDNPVITGLGQNITLLDSIGVNENTYTENLPFFITLQGNNISDVKSSDINVKISYQNNSESVQTKSAQGATAMCSSGSNPKEGSGNKYIHTIFISNIDNFNVFGNQISLGFDLNLKGIKTSDFPVEFNLEVLSDKNSSTFAKTPFVHSTNVKLKTKGGSIDEPTGDYIHARMTSPENTATGVATNAVILISLDKDIDWSYQTSPALISMAAGETPVDFSVYYGDKTIIIHHDQPLKFSTTYTINLADGLKTKDGLQMLASGSFVFTTENGKTGPGGDDPEDSFIHYDFSVPANGSDRVASDTTIRINYEKDLDWNPETSKHMFMVVAENETVVCNVSYKNRVVTLTHEAFFNYGKEYKVIISGNIPTTEPFVKVSPDVITFKAEEELPITYNHARMEPAHQSTGVASDTAIKLIYEKELAWDEKIHSQLITVTSNGKGVVCSPTYQNKVITINHDTPFAYDTEYAVNVTGNIPLVEAFNQTATETFTFTAEATPATKYIHAKLDSPSSTVDVATNTVVRISYDHALVWDDLLCKPKFTMTSGDNKVFDCEVSYANKIITLNHEKAFNYDTEYKVNISGGISTEMSFEEVASESLSFTTEKLEYKPIITVSSGTLAIAESFGAYPLRPELSIDFGFNLTSKDWEIAQKHIVLNGQVISPDYITSFDGKIAAIKLKDGCKGNTVNKFEITQFYTINRTNVLSSEPCEFNTLPNIKVIYDKEYWKNNVLKYDFIEITFDHEIGNELTARLFAENGDEIVDGVGFSSTASSIKLTCNSFDAYATYTVVLSDYRKAETGQRLEEREITFYLDLPEGVDFSGKGTEANPYKIYNAEQLLLIAASASYRAEGVHFVQKRDIDLSEYAEGEGWSPIPAFAGIYDGNNHTISNLTIARNQNNVGLFATLSSGSEVKNLGIVNCNIDSGNSRYYTGALVGNAYNCNIENCYSTGNISGYYYVGGLIGYVSYDNYSSMEELRCRITGCHSTATLTGTYNIGGLIGYCSVYGEMYHTELIIDSCYAKTTITGNSNLGGLIGSEENYGDCNVLITKCHTDCEITCNNYYVAGILGGLNGYSEFAIRYCYANVKIQANGYAAGILASSNPESFNIEQCYSTGEITCYNAAGLVTVDYTYGGYYVTNCFSTMFLPLSYDNSYSYDYNTNCCYRAQGYSPDLGWSSGPETWENSRVWETPIASFPKLLNVGGQED